MQAERSISRRNMLFGPRGSDSPPSLRVADHCLSSSGIACRACEDICDVRAIRFKPHLGGRYQLLIDAEACTGCGECLPVCPVAALSLERNPSHD